MERNIEHVITQEDIDNFPAIFNGAEVVGDKVMLTQSEVDVMAGKDVEEKQVEGSQEAEAAV